MVVMSEDIELEDCRECGCNEITEIVDWHRGHRTCPGMRCENCGEWWLWSEIEESERTGDEDE